MCAGEARAAGRAHGRKETHMPGYVDGFVIVVPKKNVGAYRRMAREAGAIWRKHGALEYRECIGDDMKAKWGMPKMTRLKPRETVFFSWILYKSRAHRDSVNAKVMKDPRILKMMASKKSPFDPKRMAYGGFKVVVEA
jgi:uncharacterized protein YbaA (DUF1428 family)